jgi:hypothetical protein
MLLLPGESVLRSAYAVLEADPTVAPGRGAGVLYLTNRRLVFESRVSRGLVRDLVGGRETRLVLDARLLDLRNISIRQGRIGPARLVVELPHGRPAFDVLDPEGWIAAISQARREHPPPSAEAHLAPQVIERQVVKVRCRFCGTLGNEVDGRCPWCGAPL